MKYMPITLCHFLALLVFVLLPQNIFAADAVMFPPQTTDGDACGSDQLRIMSWASGMPSTKCLTGQEVLKLAIPTCANNEEVVYKNNVFVCKSRVPTCTVRYATSATKVACGMVSEVQCESSEFLMTGGIIVSNASGQMSSPLVNGAGKIIGWSISVLNDGTTACGINSEVADGTVATGGPGNPPRFPIGGGAEIWGQATAVCCKYD